MLDRLATLGFRIRLGLTAVGAVVFIIFLLQNTGQIPVNFLFWEGDVPTVILILVTSLGGFAVGYLTALNARRGHRKKQEQKQASESTPE